MTGLACFEQAVAVKVVLQQPLTVLFRLSRLRYDSRAPNKAVKARVWPWLSDNRP